MSKLCEKILQPSWSCAFSTEYKEKAKIPINGPIKIKERSK